MSFLDDTTSHTIGLTSVILALIALVACSEQRDAPRAADQAAPPQVLTRLEIVERPPAPKAPELELKPLKDGRGRVSSYLPLPTDWTVRPGEGAAYTIEAPGGVRVNPTESVEYVWSNSPQMRQTLGRTGKPIAAPLSTLAILEQGIEPEARAQGYSLVDTVELPRVKAFWDAFGAAMPQTGTTRTYTAVGTEWHGAGDARSFIVILHMVADHGDMLTWAVHTTELEAPRAIFDRAKKTWLEALAHMQVDEGWRQAQGMKLTRDIQANQEEAKRWMRIGAERHRRAMADIEAAGRTALAIGKQNSEILDRSHAGFRDRSNMNSAGHAKAVDGIHEQTVVVSPQTGTRYQVQNGWKFYWSDGDKGYIGSNDPNFDPRLDPGLKHKPWVKLATPTP